MIFGGNQDTLFITKTHPCFNLSNISFLRGLWLLDAKKEISFLPMTFQWNLKGKSLSPFSQLFCCLFKTFGTSHGIW